MGGGIANCPPAELCCQEQTVVGSAGEAGSASLPRGTRGMGACCYLGALFLQSFQRYEPGRTLHG